MGNPEKGNYNASTRNNHQAIDSHFAILNLGRFANIPMDELDLTNPRLEVDHRIHGMDAETYLVGELDEYGQPAGVEFDPYEAELEEE